MKKTDLIFFLLGLILLSLPLASVFASSPTLWYGQKVIIERAVVGGSFYQKCNRSPWDHANGTYTNSHNTITLSVYVPQSVSDVNLIFYGDFDYGQTRERMGVEINGLTRYGGESGDWGGWHEFLVGPFNFHQGDNTVVLRGEHWHDWQTCPDSDASGSIHFGSTGWVKFEGSLAVPSVDIKANNSDGPISLDYNSSAALSWNSDNADYCTASGDWSGSKSTSGSESTGNLTSSKTYTITCTGPGGSASDSVTINVSSPSLSVSLSASPSSGCSPLNGVDLTASLSGAGSGYASYYFDCTNDGNWEKIVTTDSTSYTASNLCSYASAGNYTARVRVERNGISAENNSIINVQSCYSHPSVDIKANNSDGPISLDYNSSAALSWNSDNADYCTASGDWSGSKSTSGSESTGNLTSSKTYTITCTGPGGSASDSVTIYTHQVKGAISPTIEKRVRNLSDGQRLFYSSVSADPAEVLEFQIKINSGSGANNVIVRDFLPAQISLRPGTLKVNGILRSGDIGSGISLGDLGENQSRTITFLADIAGRSHFNFGTTNLTNRAFVYWSGDSISGSSLISVNKKEVLGAATGVSTGLTDNIFLDSFFLPLLLALLSLWLLKSHIIGWEEWMDKRKKRYHLFRTEKTLKSKIAQIKSREFSQGR